jgi:hypothetical protein
MFWYRAKSARLWPLSDPERSARVDPAPAGTGMANTPTISATHPKMLEAMVGP